MYRKSSLRVRFVVTGMLLLFAFSQSVAQNETLDSINLQLRQLFSGLSRPATPKWFLYDMAAHVTDSAFYQSNCPDTNETTTWYKVYGEMYHSAYDTASLLHPDVLFSRANNFYADTIPVGILNYSFYRLKNDALSTNTYFNFDTVNTVLTDKSPRPSSPYEEGVIFMAAPLVEASHFINPVFRIDPAFIFFDSFHASFFNNRDYVLKIDFGDGNGWIAFNPTVVTHRQVTYSGAGTHFLRVAIFNRENAPAYGSQSRIIASGVANIPPDETLRLPGITAGLYRQCNGRAGTTTGRTVIYLSGFDPLDFIHSRNRTAADIYNEVLHNDRLMQLKNIGYNFLVVDWENSRIDMRFNALYLVNLLEQLKCSMGDREQFVIMGESIGAVIARYALTYMESDAYQNRNTDGFFADATDINNVAYLASHPGIFKLPTRFCMPERMHNTRLLLSVDGPQQGANVPISMQLAYRYAMDIFSRYVGVDVRLYTQAFNLLLDGQAAQQVLIYHIDTESGLTFKNYSSRDDYQRFFGQLREMGDYPRFCKVVLMSNGALNGERQTNYYGNRPRTPGDRLLDIHLDLFARVLGFRIPLFGGHLTANTNPNGQGQVLDASAGRYSVRIRLRWFGIRINVGYNSLLFQQNYADVKPFCTAPGGWVGTPLPINSMVTSSGYNLSNAWLLNLFHYTIGTDGNGCWRFDSHVGLNGFLSANVDLSVCTDGMHFCLVPVQSALDYGHILNQSPALNIEHLPISNNLAQLPANADMMIGYPGHGSGIETNRSHVGFRNDAIFNLNFSANTYFSCIGHDDNVQRGMLNLEIGDEELYLENNSLQWDATYQTEYDLYVNFHNPYYQYPGVPGMLDGVYSKEDDFTIDGAGFAAFLHDRAGSPTGVGFTQQRLDPSRYMEVEQILDNCCRNFIGARRAGVPVATPVEKKKATGFIKLYPNPNEGNQALLTYTFKKAGRVRMDITNMNGQRVLNRPLAITDATKEATTIIDLSKLHLSPGLYFVRLNNGSQTLSARLLIAR